jgi:CDP-glucose 4,6-dehydratase
MSELSTHRLTLVRADVRDQAALERVLGEYQIATVLHLAAQTIVEIANRNPISTFQTNIGGTWALLEACRRSPTVEQIVVASSDKAYGDHGNVAYDEDSALRGRHPYDVSKACADLIAQSYAVSYELPVVVTRCGNFYGGGDLNWSRLVPSTIRSIYRGNPPIIRSNGLYSREYFYVEDGADAYLMLAEKLANDTTLRGQTFNFSSEEQLTVLEVVSKISEVMGSDTLPDIRNHATNEIVAQRLSTAKARSILGWQPRFSFDEGLERTVAWYTNFLNRQDMLNSAD